MICAWALSLPPVNAGHAAGGDAPWLGLGDALGVGDAVGVALGEATVADVLGAAVVGAGVDGGTAAGRGRQAPTTTTAMATASAPMRRSRPITGPSLTGIERLVENPYKRRSDFVRRAYVATKFGRMPFKWPIGCVWRWFFTSTSQRGTSHMCSRT